MDPFSCFRMFFFYFPVYLLCKLMTVLRTATRLFVDGFATVCLGSILFLSMQVNSSLNSVFSSLITYTYLRVRKSILLNMLEKVKGTALIQSVSTLNSENCVCFEQSHSGILKPYVSLFYALKISRNTTFLFENHSSIILLPSCR